MSVSISSSSLAELGVIGWRYTQLIARKLHNPKNFTQFLSDLNARALVLINASYDVVDYTVTDTEHANVAALIAGEATLAVGDVMRVAAATNDLTDNALATAKGSAVAQYDCFLLAATTVTYQGTGTGLAVAADLTASYALATPEASSTRFTLLATGARNV